MPRQCWISRLKLSTLFVTPLRAMMATFADGVVHVVSLRTNEQVGWVHAGRDIAAVTKDLVGFHRSMR